VAASAPTLLRTRSGRNVRERAIKAALLLCAGISVATTVGIVLTLFIEGVRFFGSVSIVEYFTSTRWGPNFSDPNFGVLPLLNATLLIAAIGSAVALPLGLGMAVYLSEYARPRARRIIKPILEILAGIPTVVFGYFAISFVTPSLLRPLFTDMGGLNALSAGLVVGVAIVPLVASISEDAMRAVPRSLRDAAYAVGATKRSVATKVVVPAALSGITAAFILALSRAIGETMIVAIAGGGLANFSFDPREPMQTITAFIVQVAGGDVPYGSIAHRTIFALGATLFVLTLGLNVVAFRIVRRFRQVYE
jgi:phosphate transport system permease protein